jgi:hypothetical protein
MNKLSCTFLPLIVGIPEQMPCHGVNLICTAPSSFCVLFWFALKCVSAAGTCVKICAHVRFCMFSNSDLDQDPLQLFHQNTYHHKPFEQLFPLNDANYKTLLAMVVV